MRSPTEEASALREWRSNWPVVLAALIGTVLPSFYMYSTGVVIADLESEFGWSRAEISVGPVIIAVVGLVLAPFVGAAIDRFGARRVALIGASCFLASFAMLSLAGPSLWSWQVLWCLLAIAAAAVSPTVWTAGVSGLFYTSRGLAIAVTLCGTGLGGLMIPMAATWLNEAHGWRTVYLGLSGIAALIVLPLLALFFYGLSDKRRAGRDAGGAAGASVSAPSEPAVPAREAFRSLRYIKLATAAGLAVMATNGVIFNMVPILRAHGMTPVIAAGVAGFIGLGSMTGRLLGGLLLDRINAGLVGGVSIAMPVLSCLLLLAFPGSAPMGSLAAFLLGLAMGVEFDAVAYLTSRLFGLASFGTLFGTITGLLVFFGGVSPFLANLAYDLTGSFDATIYACIPACALSALFFLTLGAPSPARK